MAPSADVLAEADIAFDGTVRSVEHGLVDLEVTQWYRGGERRPRPGPCAAGRDAGADRGGGLRGGRPVPGGRRGGDLMVCGLSAPYDDALADLYGEAFGD